MRRNQIAMNLLINLEATGASEVLRQLQTVQTRVDTMVATGAASESLRGSRNVLSLAQETQETARRNAAAAQGRIGRISNELDRFAAATNYQVGAGAVDSVKSIQRLRQFNTAVQEVQTMYRDSGMAINRTQAKQLTYDAIIMNDRSMFSEQTARSLFSQREASQRALRQDFTGKGATEQQRNFISRISSAQTNLYDYKSRNSEASADVAKAAQKLERQIAQYDKESEKIVQRLAALSGQAATDLKALELMLNNKERERKKLAAQITHAQRTGTRVAPDSLLNQYAAVTAEIVTQRHAIRNAALSGTGAQQERVARQYSVQGDADLMQQTEAYLNSATATNQSRQFYLDRERNSATNAAAGLSAATTMRSRLTSDMRRMSTNQLERELDEMVRHRESVVHMSRTQLTPSGQQALQALMTQYGVSDPDELVGLMNSQIARTRSTLGRSAAPATFGNTVLGQLMGSSRSGAYGRSNNSPFNRFNAQVTNFAQMGGLSLYGLGTIGLGTALSKNTLGQASEAESMKNVLAGMVNTYYEFYDLQGKVNDRQATFNKSLEMSETLYGKIRERAIASVLTTQEMFEYVLSGTPLLMRRGLNFDESLNVVDSVASLGKAMGYHTPAVMSDIRDLAMGTVTSRSQVLRSIGIEGSELAAATAKGPDALREYFRTKTAGFEGTLARIENTPQGRMSRFQDLMQQSAITAGEGAMPGFLKGLEDLYNQIDRLNKDGTLEKAGENLGSFLNTVTTAAASIVGNPIFQGLATNPGGALVTSLGAYTIGSSYYQGIRHRMMNPENVDEMRATGRFTRTPGLTEYGLIGTLLSDQMGMDRQGHYHPNSMRAKAARWLAQPVGVDPNFVGPMSPDMPTRGSRIMGTTGGVLKGIAALFAADQLLLPLVDQAIGVQDKGVLDSRTSAYRESRDSISLERGLASLSASDASLRTSADARRQLALIAAGQQAYQMLPDELRILNASGGMKDRTSGLHVLVAAAESMRLQSEAGGGRMESVLPKILGVKSGDAAGYRDLITSTPGLLNMLLEEAAKARGAGTLAVRPDGTVGVQGTQNLAKFYDQAIGIGGAGIVPQTAAAATTLGNLRDRERVLQDILSGAGNTLSPEDRDKFVSMLKQRAQEGTLREMLVNSYLSRSENLSVKENDTFIRQRVGLAADIQAQGYGVIGAQISRRIAGVSPYSVAATGLLGQQRALGIASAQNQYLVGMASPDANPATLMLQFAQATEQVEAAYEQSIRAIVQERVARQENIRVLKDQTSLMRMEIESVRTQGQRDALPLNTLSDASNVFQMDLRLGSQRLDMISASWAASRRAIQGQGRAEAIQSMSRSQLEKAAGATPVSLQDQMVNGFKVEFSAMQKAFSAQFSASQQAITNSTYSFEAALNEQAAAQKGLEDAVLKHAQQLTFLGGNISTLSDAVNRLYSIATGEVIPSSASPVSTVPTSTAQVLLNGTSNGLVSNGSGSVGAPKLASLQAFASGLAGGGASKAPTLSITATPIGGAASTSSVGVGAGATGGGGGLFDRMAEGVTTQILLAMGRSVKSPGSQADPACAMFASEIIAKMTKGVTDEGGKIEWGAKRLIDRVKEVGGQDVSMANAKPGDLAWIKSSSAPSGYHVGIYVGGGKVMDMNGQQQARGGRNRFGTRSASGWSFVSVPSEAQTPVGDIAVGGAGGSQALQDAQIEQARIQEQLERERAMLEMQNRFRAEAANNFALIERMGSTVSENAGAMRRALGIGSTARGAEAIQERYFGRLDAGTLMRGRFAQFGQGLISATFTSRSSQIANRALSGEISEAQAGQEFDQLLSETRSRYLKIVQDQIDTENIVLEKKATFARELEKVTRTVTLGMGDMARTFEASLAGIGVYGPGRGLAMRSAERQRLRGGIEDRRSNALSDLQRDSVAWGISPNRANALRVAAGKAYVDRLGDDIRGLMQQDAADQAQFAASQTRIQLGIGVQSARSAYGLNMQQLRLDQAQRSFGVGIGGQAMGLGQQMQDAMAQSLQSNLATLGVREAEIRQNRFNSLVKRYGPGEGAEKYNSDAVQREIQAQIEQLQVRMLRQAARSYNSPNQQNAIRSAIMQDRIVNTVGEGGGSILANPMMLFAGSERSSFMSALVGPYASERMGQLGNRLALSGALATGRNLSAQQLQQLGLRSIKGKGLFEGDRSVSANQIFRRNLGESAAAFGGNLLGQFAGTALGGDRASVDLGTQIGALAGPGLFAGLGMFGGPVGAVAGGILGGLFGRRRNNQDEQEARQWRQNVLRLMAQMDKSLRPVSDYFQTAKGEQLFGTASRYLGNRYNSGLGREAALGVL